MTVEMENKQYEIKTIRDLLCAASETQDFDGLLEDLRMCVSMCLAAAKFPEVDKEELFDAFSCFRWTDDGIREGELTIRPKE